MRRSAQLEGEDEPREQARQQRVNAATRVPVSERCARRAASGAANGWQAVP